MRLGAVPQNVFEAAALAAGEVPTPLIDTLVALLLANTVMTGTSVGLFDALADGPLSAEEVAARCQTDPRATERLLRALCGCKYLRWQGDRYGLARLARRWLIRHREGSVAAAVLHRTLDLRFMTFEDYVRKGISQDFHTQLTPSDWEIYHAGQASHAELVIAEVLELVQISGQATRLLDLGGGHGRFALAFCRRYSSLHADVVDLARTAAQDAPSVSNAIADRIHYHVADIRSSAISEQAYDVVLLANVVHHFDGPTNRRLIEGAARALREDGMLVVIDAFRSRSNKHVDQIEALMDLYFGAASGSRLWAIEDVRRWMIESGLRLRTASALRKMPLCRIQVAAKTSRSEPVTT